ncbi:molecular chaperone DnaJ [Pseudoduganella lutea]|uniref:Molecular chaperone DnaJ n=1 Tax=Pseudoduganella lutea TaxID=321985 RepID=A0A4P6L4T1_9BURK|nr:molecular chaperone DnaJ [Pseudoduganella lutea]
MSAITATLYPCAHCKETGACSTGHNGLSCAVCVGEHTLKGEHYGLACGVCGGMGKAEPRTERINKRMAPILAYSMVILLLIAIGLAAYTNKHLSEILAFAGTVIGAITGHYFSRSET